MSARKLLLLVVSCLVAVAPACNCGTPPENPDGGQDGGRDAGPDAGPPDSGPQGCGLRTCASAGAQCGPIGDGCGAVLDCGSCPFPQTCGGGGTPYQCGGSNACVPRTCAQMGANCGPMADGCGNLLDCGTCTAPQTCGGGGFPNSCGVPTVSDGGFLPDGGCRPRTCAELGANCGPVGDGCGGQIASCGTCMGTETCGGGGMPSRCGTPPSSCTPMTCAQLGATCGWVGDGCGNAIQCGGCDGGAICGGGGAPNQCGGSTDAGCTNLCLRQQPCADGGTTTLTGTVFAPTDPAAGFGNPDPLPNTLVYVPNAPVAPFTPGVSCDVCGAPASGNPLVTAMTDVDGGFVLRNVPVGADVPLVMQLGRWRRQVTIPNVPACQTTPLPATLTRMPRNKTEGDIPRIAMVTGNVDTIECVLRKMGIDEAEFTVPDGGGRVEFFIENGAQPAAGTAPLEDVLVDDQAMLDRYDLVIFACRGGHEDKTTARKNRVIAYANKGGRVYTTHFSYGWLYNIPPWDQTAAWTIQQGSNNPVVTVDIHRNFPKGDLMANWLYNIGSSTALGQIPLGVLRNDFRDAGAPQSETWITWNGNNPPWPIHYTFNTPVGQDAGVQCGRVVFSDFHVRNASNAGSQRFPNECVAGPMTAQEKVLEFMLFDLGSCIVQSNPGPICVPRTCSQQGFTCGQQGDGCGNIINCGTCTAPQTCGGGGTPNQCGTTPCQPRTCAQLGIQCGPAGDGCGGLLQCGTCFEGATCGGGGVPGQCGSGSFCQPQTCAQQGYSCGPAGDGCGNALNCGTCTAPQTCGGGGTPGVCGVPPCTPASCQSLGYNCGAAGDGCGGLIQCGTCPPDAGTCGGGGRPNVCGTLIIN